MTAETPSFSLQEIIYCDPQSSITAMHNNYHIYDSLYMCTFHDYGDFIGGRTCLDLRAHRSRAISQVSGA